MDYEYLTLKEMAEKWGISDRMITIYCNEGRIPGAFKKGNMWLVPENAKKPEDRRRKEAKRIV